MISGALPTVEALHAAVRERPEDISVALTLGDYYAHAREEEQIVSAIAHLERKYPFPEASDNSHYNRLLALGYGHSDRCLEAEVIVERALRDSAGSPDLFYVQAYVKMTMREHDDVIEACSRYFAALKACHAPGVRCDDVAVTNAHVSQLYNMLGSAYREKHQYAEAEAACERAIRADAGNHLPYLNIAHVQQLQNKRSEAVDTVRRGIAGCRQVQELRMLQETFRSCATVSACMIVKNEEELLPGCLDSIRDWVDEIVIVDTGSTDRTVEIAKQYGARVFHQPWEGNFSKHRNYSMDLATGDWVFIIDADERFVAEDLGLLRPLLNVPQVPAISIDVYNVYGQDEESTSFLPSIRFFRRNLNLRYEGIVHNLLKVPPGVDVHRAGVRIKHLGYDLTPEKMADKAVRTSTLLKQQLEENPDDVFALFNYAQLLTGRRHEDITAHAEDIMRMAGRVVELTSPENPKERHLHLMCLNQMAWTCLFTGRCNEAEELAKRSLKYKPNYLDPMLLLGHIATRREKHDEAAVHYQRYLDEQARYDASREVDNMIINHVNSRANALYGLAMISDLKGQRERAKSLYRQTLTATPGYLEANALLGRILLAEGEVDEAEECFRRQIAAGGYSREAWAGLGEIAARRGDLTQAERAFREVLKQNPKDSETMIKFGRVLRDAGRPDEAGILFSQAAELSQGDGAVNARLAEELFAMGKYSEAADGYKAALAKEESSGLYNDLGNCYFRLEKFGEAAENYRRALEFGPTAAISYRNLGLAEARQGRNGEALEALERYLEHESGDHEVVRLVGDLRLGRRDYGGALRAYEKILTRTPHDAPVLFRLSECYLHMGHSDSAIMGYRRVLELDPACRPAQERLSQLAGAVARI
jgi:tetratricopeptide (TPR) repeat protein